MKEERATHYSTHVWWSDEDEAFVASAIEFGGGVSATGETPAEALAELQVAVELALESYVARDIDPPRPHSFSGQLRVRMPSDLHAWLSLEAQRQGVSLNTYMVTCLAEARGRRSRLEVVDPELLQRWDEAIDRIDRGEGKDAREAIHQIAARLGLEL